MSGQQPKSGRVSAFVLVGLMVLAIPAGLSLVRGLPTASTTTETVITPTLPPVNLTDTPTATPSDTPTPTPTPTEISPSQPSPGNGSNDTTTHVVGTIDDPNCGTPEHSTIQAAVDAAEPGDTVLVCAGIYPENVDVPTHNITIRGIGNPVIRNGGKSVVQINASQVVLRGFTVHADGANYAIVAGAEETLILDNTVNTTEIGIFLSDGLTNQGGPDPELRAATGSRVVNNSVTAEQYRIWADADQSVIRDNFVTDLDGEQPGNDDPFNISILSTGNDSVIRNNTVRITYPAPAFLDWEDCRSGLCRPETYFNASGIKLGWKIPRCASRHYCDAPSMAHNWAHNNRIVNNYVTGVPWSPMKLSPEAKGSVVRNNTVTRNRYTMDVYANETVIRNNTITHTALLAGNYNRGDFQWGLEILGHDVRVIGNTIKQNGQGVNVEGGNVTIKENTITNNRGGVGLFVSGGANGTTIQQLGRSYGPVVVVDNRIVGTEGAGIRISVGKERVSQSSVDKEVVKQVIRQIDIHRNLILDNEGRGIRVSNANKTDGFWPIVNATNNIWDCGGPSSGGEEPKLKDPYTGRKANGSGNGISAGDGEGVSNVHFDPFQVHNPSSCPASQQGPTPTPSLTPRSTPSPTQTPTPPPAAGTGNSTDGPDGNGTGETEGPGGLGVSGTDGTTKGTSSSTPTAPPTASPSPTTSPTPMVEPGFGVSTWVIGGAVVLWQVIIKRRSVEKDE